MKLTESQLRKIIKEELKKVLSEGDVESMKDYSKQDKYHASVLKRLYGDNQELKDLAQKGKQKEFAIKLGELVKADDPEATVKFFGNQRWGGSNRFVMSSQAKELFYSMKETEAAPVADNSNVLSFKPKLNEMDLTTVGLGMLGGIAGVGLFFGVKVLGQAALEKFAEGKDTYEHLKKQIEQKKAEEILTNQAADAAIKVIEILNKHMDNQELIDLVKNRKLKEFAAKLEELEGGDVDSSSVYKKFKSRLGMPKNSATKKR